MKNWKFLLLGILIGTNLMGADISINGFVEEAISTRINKEAYIKDDFIIYETIARLDVSGTIAENAEFTLKAEISQDEISDESELKLREAYIWFMPNDYLEIKAGRQVLTWGTGDLLFINDLFPKDYKSFFYGRNIDLMKAPSNAIKLSIFPEKFIVDLVLIPSFSPNEYIDGTRFAYYNPLASRFVSPGYANTGVLPDEEVQNMEFALRLKRTIKEFETALYGYRGFYKNPNMNSDYTGMEFARLQVLGGSVVGDLFGGVFNAEFGYEDSLDDEKGDLGNIPNSYLKSIVGYKRDLIKDLSIGVQYQLEHMMDYGDYKKSLAGYKYLADENRSLVSLRLTKLMKQQTIRSELFTYYSPSDNDGYVNLNIDYDLIDGLKYSIGGNMFYGEKDYTFFGQLRDNSNIYTRLRYSF